MDIPNKNIFSAAKIKPVEYNIRMLESNTPTHIKIKDLYKKTDLDEHNFYYDRIFTNKNNAQDIFQFAYKKTISKAFDGINTSFLTLGVNGSGKSRLLFGEDQNQYGTQNSDFDDLEGVVTKTIRAVLTKADDMSETRDITLTVNFYEIYLDKIRDLLRGHPNIDFQEKLKNAANYEDMEVEDGSSIETNREKLLKTGLVRGGCAVAIKSMEDYEKVMQFGFGMRESYMRRSRDNSSSNRAHIVFILLSYRFSI